MNVIILCEGESDRVVLDRYFCKRFGFRHKGDGKPRNDGIQDCYYKKGRILLTIRAVQGCTKFCAELEDVLHINYVNTNLQNRFTHVAVVTDMTARQRRILCCKNLIRCCKIISCRIFKMAYGVKGVRKRRWEVALLT